MNMSQSTDFKSLYTYIGNKYDRKAKEKILFLGPFVAYVEQS